MLHFLGWYVMRKEEYKLNIEHAKIEARFISSLRSDERTRLLCKIDEEREKRQEAERARAEAQAMYAEEVEKRYSLARKLAQMERGEESDAV